MSMYRFSVVDCTFTYIVCVNNKKKCHTETPNVHNTKTPPCELLPPVVGGRSYNPDQ